jgi:branched-chain amino acid transport system substrate-binding protein
MKHFFRILLIVLFLTSPAHGESDPITLGGTLGLTGKYAPLSEMVASGLTLWCEQINQRGGLMGRQVQLTIYDDTCDSKVAKKYYEKMILEDKTDLVFGPFSSVITTEIVKVTEKHGYSVLASGAASDQLWQQKYTHLFGVYIPASRYAFGFLKFCFKNNIKRIAIVTPNDMFSETVAAGAEKWAIRLGMTVVLNESFQKGTKELKWLATKIKKSGAEAVVVGGHFAESVDIRQALKTINWFPRAYFATLGPALQKYYDILQQDAEGTFTLSNWEAQGVDFPGSKKFATDFLVRFKVKPSYQAAAGFSVGQILEAAIQKTGSLDKEKIRNTLASLDTMTILGRYGVDSTGQQIRHFSLLMQWQDGQLKIVGPTGLKSVHTVPALFN